MHRTKGQSVTVGEVKAAEVQAAGHIALTIRHQGNEACDCPNNFLHLHSPGSPSQVLPTVKMYLPRSIHIIKVCQKPVSQLILDPVTVITTLQSTDAFSLDTCRSLHHRH